MKVRPAVLLVSLLACGVQYVKGPDGKNDWFKVSCHREVTCMKQASARCPSGFYLNDPETNTTNFSASAPKGEADDNAATKLREMLARCGQNEEDHSLDNNDDDEGFKPIAKSKDLSGCGRAYDKINELSEAWLNWHPDAAPPDKKPGRGEFVNVCGDLPEEAQFCLSVKYATSHAKDCNDAFEDLPKKTLVRLASLFEKDGQNPADIKIPLPEPVVDMDASVDGAVGEGGVLDGAVEGGADAGKGKPKPAPKKK